MLIENEIKLLGIDAEEIRKFLNSNGVSMQKKVDYRRTIFDVIPHDDSAWIRLRSDGEHTELTYKKRHHDGIDGTEEIEVGVGDFEKLRNLLEKAGLVSRNYQENTREIYLWKNCEITIDTWPGLEPYVEIEADDASTVENVVAEFEGLYKETSTESTDKLYLQIGIDIKSLPELKF